MEIEILKKAGLTDSQAKGYMALIDNGPLSPTDIAKLTNETRTNAYAIADKLVSLGLAKRKNSTNFTIEAENPTRLKALLQSKQVQLKKASDELGGILPDILSKYKLTSDLPGVLSVEGVDSLELIYDEIIQTNQDVLVMARPYDRSDPEISEMIDKQIERKRQAGIKTLALVRPESYDQLNKQADKLFEVKKLPAEVTFDSEIIICGNTVVSTVYNHGIVSSIIVSPETASTLRSMFYLVWNSLK